ncbi:MAG: SpoIIE family protein phosphatase [Leptospiraceae bacterium]|nr:SpoIIE family protein phosphatase [Leptospiraceae bacterium]
MNLSRLILLFIGLFFFSNTACKQATNSILQIPIAWEYAESEQYEPLSFLADKEFKPLEESQINALATLVPNEKGFLWVKGSFNFNSTNEPIAITLGKIISAEETYINRFFLGRTIRKTKEQWNFWNLYRHYPVPKEHLLEGKNEILLKVYVDSEGAIPAYIEIGNREEIDAVIFSKMFYESYLNGIVTVLFIVIALYHLLIYWKRKQDKENLYYAIFCFSYSLYGLNFVSWILGSFLDVNYFYFQKFIFTSMFVSAYALYRFISIFLKRNDRKWFSILFMILLVIPLLITIGAPSYNFMYKTRGIIMLFIMPFLVYILFVPVYNYIKYKNMEAKTMLASLVIIFTIAFHDIFNVVFKWNSSFWVGPGIPLFMGSIMFLLGNKFVDVYNQTDELNETLEQKVVERTKEVMEKMDVIKALNIQQDGDYYLTSLIERPLGTNYNKSKNVKTEFYVEQKKRFQFKNRNSELGGDICISGNLRFGDGKDRYVFFFNGDAMGKSMQGAGGAIVAGTVVNSILARSARNNKIQKISPKDWITETYLELDSVFKTFDGSMLMSCACGVINEKTGQMWYFNAEHPWGVIYRDGKADFIESGLNLRKLGTIIEGNVFQVQEFQFCNGDIFFAGSDGRDDLDISLNGGRDMNEDETKFLRAVESSAGEITKLVEIIHSLGKVTDDLSLIRIEFHDKEEEQSATSELIGEAKNLINSGSVLEGISKLLEHLNQKPEDLSALEILSNLYYEQKEYREASFYMEKILALSPNDLDTIFNLSLCYKHMREYDLSTSFAEKLLEMNPKKISNIINLADNYRIKGDYLKSRESLNLAIDSISFFENAVKLDRILKAKGY